MLSRDTQCLWHCSIVSCKWSRNVTEWDHTGDETSPWIHRAGIPNKWGRVALPTVGPSCCPANQRWQTSTQWQTKQHSQIPHQCDTTTSSGHVQWYNTCIRPSTCHTALSAGQLQRQMYSRLMPSISGIRWSHHVRNDDVRRTTKPHTLG